MQPTVGIRVAPGPKGPTTEERAAREVPYTPSNDKCLASRQGNATSKPQKRNVNNQARDICLEVAYMKTNGKFVGQGETPTQTEIFATTLIIMDRNKQMMRAIPVEAETVTAHIAEQVVDFLSG